MSVNPGFGGQTFIPSALDRIRRLRGLIDERNPGCRLEIDGGVKASNIRRVVDAGADMVVVGSAIFAPDLDVIDAVRSLREAVAS
jgi:ribulose-phosphate 3-epimerase